MDDDPLVSLRLQFQIKTALLGRLEENLQSKIRERGLLFKKDEIQYESRIKAGLIRMEALKCEHACLSALLNDKRNEAIAFSQSYQIKMRESRELAILRGETNVKIKSEIARLTTEIHMMEQTADCADFQLTGADYFDNEKAAENYSEQISALDDKIDSFKIREGRLLEHAEEIAKVERDSYVIRLSKLHRDQVTLRSQIIDLRNNLRKFYLPADAVSLFTWAESIGKMARAMARWDLTNPVCKLDAVILEGLWLRWAELNEKKRI